MHRNLEALVKSARISLDTLRRRISVSSMINYGDGDTKKDQVPAFKANLILAIPNIEMRPTLDDIQQTVNKVAQIQISVFKSIPLWGQNQDPSKKPSLVSETDKVAISLDSCANNTSNNAAVSTARLDGPVTKAKNYFRYKLLT